MWSRAAAGLALAVVAALTTPAGGAPSPDDGAGAAIVFCRRVEAGTGRRVGVGDRFAIGRKRDVDACVDLARLAPGRTYQVHLVWLDPAGNELFRKYAHLTPHRGDGAWWGDLRWKSAEDLVRSDRDTLRGAGDTLTLRTSLGIAPERQRPLGEYRLRVYLDRRLVAESAFTLLPEEAEKPPQDRPAESPRKKSGGRRAKSGRSQTAPPRGS